MIKIIIKWNHFLVKMDFKKGVSQHFLTKIGAPTAKPRIIESWAKLDKVSTLLEDLYLRYY